MKIVIRFVTFFAAALFCFCCYIGVVMMLIFDMLLPKLNIDASLPVFLLAFIFSFVSAGVLVSYIFVKPLLLILSTLKNLSENKYNLNTINESVHNSKGHIKKRYFLFRESITALNELGAQLAVAEKEREQLEQAKKDWVRGISHDIKTPLSYVQGYSALLSNPEYEWKPEEQEKFLKEIYSKGKYIEDLVNDLKLSFEIDDPETVIPLTKTEFDLIIFLQNMIADVANNPKAADNNFSFDSAVTSMTINADEKLLYRAFLNLLVNSVLHNPPKTEIMISVIEPQEDTVVIKVKDNGVGINESAQEIFQNELSYQKGWNGLTIVKNIILAHGGSISLNSSENTGSTYTIKLPC